MEVDPGALPDALLQMAYNNIFIPLSMLTTASLNCIKTNEHIMYKHISYGPRSGKAFLDEDFFLTEDDLDNFEFGQAYTNWLMLIEAILDPIIEQGWCKNHST